jgi:predicted ATPase/transcriptional regulator with XRE-family HTH domain
MTPTDTTTLRQLIRQFRIGAGLSQESLAARAGVSTRAVSDLERGLRSVPRIETIRAIADALVLDERDRAALLAAARPDILQSPDQPSSLFVSPASTSTRTPLHIRPLPRPLTTLIGRDAYLDQVVTLLRSSETRLVTLTGPGGVGKTRLGLAIADDAASFFPDGLVFVDLSAISHPEAILSAISDALGISPDSTRPPIDRLHATISDRSLLLLIDNFEQVTEGAPFLTDLLGTCPGLKMLVTSRIRLRLRGEQVVAISPLAMPPLVAGAVPEFTEIAALPAVQLFVARAREAQLDFALTEENAPTVAEICRRVDGLPLAIELAASRIALFSPAALLERLDKRLPVLSKGPRDAPARHRTLQDTIAWSYDLLSPDEQLVFRRLAVFAGGFTLDAATAVSNEASIDVVAAIEALGENSLVVPMTASGREARFTMLETIREFALARLVDVDEAHGIREHHAAWFAALARECGRDLRAGRNATERFARLDVEVPNLRAAVEFRLANRDGEGVMSLLTSSAFYWSDRPYLVELRVWLESAIRQAPDAPAETRSDALYLLAYTTSLLGDPSAAERYAEEGNELAESLGSPSALGLNCFARALIAEFANEVVHAAALYEEALPLLQQAGEHHVALVCMSELGDKWVLMGDLTRGVLLLDESIVTARQQEAETELTQALIRRGLAALAEGEPALAADLLAQGLTRARTRGIDRWALGAIAGLAGAALALDKPETAAQLMGAVAAASETIGAGRIAEALHAERIGRAIEKRLGSETFARCWSEGRFLTYDQAATIALTVTGRASDKRSRFAAPSPR